jgi:hypothetical protein
VNTSQELGVLNSYYRIAASISNSRRVVINLDLRDFKGLRVRFARFGGARNAAGAGAAGAFGSTPARP